MSRRRFRVQLDEDPDLSRVSAACATEGFQVALQKNIRLGFGDPVAYVREFG